MWAVGLTVDLVKPQHRVYRPDKRPDVEVLVDGIWHVAELRMWSQLADGSWVANVQWRPAGEATRRLETFAATDVRAAEAR